MLTIHNRLSTQPKRALRQRSFFCALRRRESTLSKHRSSRPLGYGACLRYPDRTNTRLASYLSRSPSPPARAASCAKRPDRVSTVKRSQVPVPAPPRPTRLRHASRLRKGTRPPRRKAGLSRCPAEYLLPSALPDLPMLYATFGCALCGEKETKPAQNLLGELGVGIAAQRSRAGLPWLKRRMIAAFEIRRKAGCLVRPAPQPVAQV